MREPARAWISAAVELFDDPVKELVYQKGEIQAGVDPDRTQNSAVGIVRVRYSRGVVIRLTNPFAKRIRVKLNLRSEPIASGLSNLNANVALSATSVQIDGHRTRVIQGSLTPQAGRPGRTPAEQRADAEQITHRAIVWIEIESSGRIVPGGELRLVRTSGVIKDTLPSMIDSQAVAWFELPDPGPTIPGGGGEASQPGGEQTRRPRR